jgi:hypothetical protein
MVSSHSSKNLDPRSETRHINFHSLVRKSETSASVLP